MPGYSIRIFSPLLILFTASTGCKTVSTHIIDADLGGPSRSINTVAVMRFNDERIQNAGVKGTIVKTISNPQAGELVAGILTSELARRNKYRILTRSEIKDMLKKAGYSEKELVSGRNYSMLGKILGVDAIIIGEIYAFGISDMRIYERGNVSFTAECIGTKDGKILWTMNVKESAPYKDELELAGKAIREAMENINMR